MEFGELFVMLVGTSLMRMLFVATSDMEVLKRFFSGHHLAEASEQFTILAYSESNLFITSYIIQLKDSAFIYHSSL